MAWQYPTHACGHDGARYQAYGRNDDRVRQLKAIEARACPDCRRRDADQQSTDAGLPLLSGSPQQISWAHDIRARALRLLPPDRVAKYRPEQSASWWINNRSMLGS